MARLGNFDITLSRRAWFDVDAADPLNGWFDKAAVGVEAAPPPPPPPLAGGGPPFGGGGRRPAEPFLVDCVLEDQDPGIACVSEFMDGKWVEPEPVDDFADRILAMVDLNVKPPEVRYERWTPPDDTNPFLVMGGIVVVGGFVAWLIKR